jgi:hypothetical protein
VLTGVNAFAVADELLELTHTVIYLFSRLSPALSRWIVGEKRI